VTRSRQETHDWYDDADSLEAPRATTQALPRIPASWHHFSWWLAGTTFSAMWMLETWTAALPGQTHAGSLAESFWALILALGICYGTYNFSKSQSRPLAHLLCVVSAVVLLLNHAFGA
jgi:hypothetical protein